MMWTATLMEADGTPAVDMTGHPVAPARQRTPRRAAHAVLRGATWRRMPAWSVDHAADGDLVAVWDESTRRPEAQGRMIRVEVAR